MLSEEQVRARLAKLREQGQIAADIWRSVIAQDATVRPARLGTLLVAIEASIEELEMVLEERPAA